MRTRTAWLDADDVSEPEPPAGVILMAPTPHDPSAWHVAIASMMWISSPATRTSDAAPIDPTAVAQRARSKTAVLSVAASTIADT
jgi:hypothetical protein